MLGARYKEKFETPSSLTPEELQVERERFLDAEDVEKVLKYGITNINPINHEDTPNGFKKIEYIKTAFRQFMAGEEFALPNVNLSSLTLSVPTDLTLLYNFKNKDDIYIENKDQDNFNHIFSLVYDAVGKRFIVIDTVNYDLGYKIIKNDLEKNKAFLESQGLEFESVEMIPWAYNNGDNDCAINATLNSVLVPHLLAKSDEKIELTDLAQKINIIGESEKFKDFREKIRQKIEKNQTFAENTINLFLTEADAILRQETIKKLTLAVNKLDKKLTLAQDHEIQHIPLNSRINTLALKAGEENSRIQHSLFTSNEEVVGYDVSFENLRVGQECAYGRILGEYMKLNPNAEIKVTHTTSKGAIIQCSKWLDEIKESKASDATIKELEKIFLMAVEEQSGLDSSSNQLKKVKENSQTIKSEDVQMIRF